MINKMTRDQVFEAINGERHHQFDKWGSKKQQSLPGYLLILRNELAEAEEGWSKGILSGRHSPLYEILQIAATAVACLERYGTNGSAIATDDVPLEEIGDKDRPSCYDVLD